MIIHKNYQLYSGKCEKSYPLLDPQRTLYYILCGDYFRNILVKPKHLSTNIKKSM